MQNFPKLIFASLKIEVYSNFRTLKEKGLKIENPEVRWGTDTFRGLSTSYGSLKCFLYRNTLFVIRCNLQIVANL